MRIGNPLLILETFSFNDTESENWIQLWILKLS